MIKKKRPKYIQELVKETNKRLEIMNIKDEGDTLFRFVCDLLLKKNMYDGYNFFQKKTIVIDGEQCNFLDYQHAKSLRQESGIACKFTKNKFILIWFFPLQIV